MSILDQIAKPQMADIVGALDARQQRIERDEAKRKEIRMGQLIAQSLPHLKEGSPLREMAETMPREFSAFAKAAGIPLNDGERMQQFVNDTETLYTLAKNDPKEAFDYALNLSEERKEAGLNTAQIDKFIEGMREDPQRTMTGLFMTRKILNRDEEIQDRKLGLEERALDIQEKRLAADSDKSGDQYFQQLPTANGLYAFNARTGTAEPVMGADGRPLMSANTDVALQADLSGAKKESANEADRRTEAKKSLSRSDQLLANIGTARGLLPNATGSLAGAGRDAVLRGVGVTTDSSKNAAKLETLAGWMVANVPRMEGPQSNIDVENYRTMAGRVGDRTLPVDERLAALDVLEGLQQKYADLNRDITGQKKESASLSSRDQQALDWARSNPDDPRSAAIRRKLGMQ